MPLFRNSFFLIIAFLGCLTVTRAQRAIVDTNFYQISINNAIDQYHRSRGEQSALYNGVQHIGYSPLIEGHAYFETKEWQKGWVIYYGVLYKNVSLKYDLLNDEVVIQHPDAFHAIALLSENVKEFFLPGHLFVRIEQDSIIPLATGFYEKLATGTISTFVRKTKNIKEDIETRQIKRSFIDIDFYYALKDGVYHSIKNRRSMLNLVGDKKKEIKKYLKKSKIKYSENPQLALVKIAEYYTQSNR